MSQRNSRLSQILASLTDAAINAAEGVGDIVHNAGQAVGEKYDAVKVNLELNRLLAEQEKIFASIGRALFLIQSDARAASEDAQDTDIVDAQQTLDYMLLLADQKQQDIDLLSDRLSLLTGDKVCGECRRVCGSEDAFCSGCGAKLPKKN